MTLSSDSVEEIMKLDMGEELETGSRVKFLVTKEYSKSKSWIIFLISKSYHADKKDGLICILSKTGIDDMTRQSYKMAMQRFLKKALFPYTVNKAKKKGFC